MVIKIIAFKFTLPDFKSIATSKWLNEGLWDISFLSYTGIIMVSMSQIIVNIFSIGYCEDNINIEYYNTY